MLVGRQDHFGQRCLAKVEGDIEEVVSTFLAIVSDDISMIITRLKKLDFMLCKTIVLVHEPFDSYRPYTPCTLQHRRTIRAVAYGSA